MTKILDMRDRYVFPKVTASVLLLLSLTFTPRTLFCADSATREQLVFGVHPYKSATELQFMFGPLTAYLSSILGKPVELRVAKDYDGHIEQMGRDELDVAFMGPASYVQMEERFGQKPLLVRLEVSRLSTYYGVIAVAKDSPITTLQDLKGKRMAFSDRRSTSGHIIPRYMIYQSGISLEDFSEHIFMRNYDNVALGVLFGDYDAGAVNQEVFAKYEHRGLRILALTPPISEHLFVASSSLPVTAVESLRGGLLKLKDTPGGGAIMRAIKPSLTSLVPVQESDYENLRIIMRELETGGLIE